MYVHDGIDHSKRAKNVEVPHSSCRAGPATMMVHPDVPVLWIPLLYIPAITYTTPWCPGSPGRTGTRVSDIVNRQRQYFSFMNINFCWMIGIVVHKPPIVLLPCPFLTDFVVPAAAALTWSFEQHLLQIVSSCGMRQQNPSNTSRCSCPKYLSVAAVKLTAAG